MKQSIVELAKECGAVVHDADILGKCIQDAFITLTKIELQAFANAWLNQELDGQEASNSDIEHYVFINGKYYLVGIPLFTRPPITAERELELLAEIASKDGLLEIRQLNIDALMAKTHRGSYQFFKDNVLTVVA